MKLLLTISVLDPRPAMTETRLEHRGTFEEAATIAEAAWRMTGRRTMVCSGTWWLLRIDAEGVVTNRNQPGGKISVEKLSLKVS